MAVPIFSVGDTLQLKKPHPCGSALFWVILSGSDMRIRCQGCGREINIPRMKLETSIKSVWEDIQKT